MENSRLTASYRFKVTIRSDRESRFEDVHAQLHQLARHCSFPETVMLHPGDCLAIAPAFDIEDIYAIVIPLDPDCPNYASLG